MLRVTKLTDYATVVLTALAARAGARAQRRRAGRARAAGSCRRSAKVLKPLAQAGLVEGFRGANGGYRLARAAGADQPDRDRRGDGRPARHDRMQRATHGNCGIEHSLRRARQLAADQRRRRRRAARRDPGRDAAPPPPAIAAQDPSPLTTGERLRPAMAIENALKSNEQLGRRYDAGFVTDIESDTLAARPERGRGARDLGQEGRAGVDDRLAPDGLSALADDDRRRTGPSCNIAPIDFQAISYFAAPKAKYASLDEVDPQELLETYDKLGVPLHERARLAGVAVDAVFDSVSVGTTFRKELAEKGVIFCSMSEAVQRTSRAGPQVPRAAWCRRATTISPRSIRRCSPTAASCSSPRACAARWS